MSTPFVYDPLTINNWERKADKQINVSTFWGQISNRVTTPAAELPWGESRTLPDSVIHYCSTKGNRGYKTSVMMLEKGYSMGVGGAMKLKGKEFRVKTRWASTFYNVQRDAVEMGNKSIEGDQNELYRLGAQKSAILAEKFAEQDDYNKQRAIVERADEFLTEDKYWEDHEDTDLQSAPVAAALHPQILYKGQTGAEITWSATPATYLANVVTAAKAMGPTSIFDMASLRAVRLYATRRVRPLKWSAQGSTVNFIIKISEYQAEQLTTDSEWKQTYRDGDVRSPDNRSITDVIGVWRDCLIVVDARAPVLRLNSGSEGVLYVKPDTESTDNILGPDTIDRVVKGAATAATGTCEIAMILGAGALGCPVVHGLQYTTDTEDYGFESGLAGMCKKGDNRMEWRYKGDTARPYTSGSFLYLTATPTMNVG